MTIPRSGENRHVAKFYDTLSFTVAAANSGSAEKQLWVHYAVDLLQALGAVVPTGKNFHRRLFS
jgi:hypothetical protein